MKVSEGREARLRVAPREGPVCVPKPPFHCEHEIGFTAQSRHRSGQRQSVPKGGKRTSSRRLRMASAVRAGRRLPRGGSPFRRASSDEEISICSAVASHHHRVDAQVSGNTSPKCRRNSWYSASRRHFGMKTNDVCGSMSCGLGSRSRRSAKFLSCAWLLTLELRRWTAGNVKLLLPTQQSRRASRLR
jgi:hypothetical protein